MSSPPLAAGVVFEKGLYGRFVVEAMVGAVGIVEGERVAEVAVEGFEVGKEEVVVEVGEGFLEGAASAFEMGAHRWGFWGR